MVIALGLTVVAACYFYFRRKDRESDEQNSPKKLIDDVMASEAVQDAILRLSGATTLDELQATIKDALCLALPNVCEVVVYLLNPDTQELVSSDGLTHTLPKDGLGADVVRQRSRIQIDGIDPADPLSGLLQSGTKPLDEDKIVLCSPVVEKEDDRVIALILSVNDELSSSDIKNLEFLEKQLAVCYHRIKKTSSPSHTNLSNHITKEKGPKHTESILKLCAELFDQDAASLQLKVIKYLEEVTNAECGFLLLKSQDDELFCQVIGARVLEEEIGFPNHQDNLQNTKEPLTFDDLHEDQRAFLTKLLGYEIFSLLCVPVISKVSNDTVALACLVNKRGANRFSGGDLDSVCQCFQYTAPVLTSTVAFQKEQRLKNQTQTLLKVAKNLFRQLDDLTVLLRGIMQEARNLTNAERCSVFLVEKETNELVAKVFDGIAADAEQTEIRLPTTQGIAGYVATTGEILNIHDAYSHPLFFKGMDDETGFKTRNILCFPIKDDNEVIGVAQLCNKKNGAYFTVFDVEIAKAFSVYCCISIVHGLLYQKVQDAQSRSRLANELMSYHMKVNEDDVSDLLTSTVPPIEHFGENFSTFDCIPRGLHDKDLVHGLMSMFDELGFIHKWRIRKETLSRFTLMMKRGYRDNPYHNWMHAFSVAHFCYLCIQNLDLTQYLTDIEMLALFVGCIGHDIDHRGTNNSFQVASQSALATLYSSEGSVMERHHFAQTVCILNLDSCNIFENHSEKDYRKVLDLIQHVILATDLAHHLRIIKDLQALAENGYDVKTDKCHKLLLCLIMTCSDLSDQTKSWQNSKTVAECVYKEFFCQGDLEKSMGRKPLDMMDRERACIPDLQIGFLDHICEPVFGVLAKMFPKAQQCVDAVRSHKSMWTKVSNRLKAGQLTSNSSLDIFEMDLDSEEEQKRHREREELCSEDVREQPEEDEVMEESD